MALKARILRLEARQPVNVLADLSEAELETMLAQLHVLRAARNDADLDSMWGANGWDDTDMQRLADLTDRISQ
jgi:hypothetical protein